MLNFIEELKTKPDGHKKQVALFASLAITALIVLVWLISFRFLGNGYNNDNLTAKTITPVKEVRTAIENSTRKMVNGINQAKANLQGIFNTAASNALDASSSAPQQRQ